MAEEKVEKMAGEQAEQKPEQDVRPEAEQESNSAQLTKITNQAMNVMAASQQLTGAPSRQTPTHPN